MAELEFRKVFHIFLRVEVTTPYIMATKLKKILLSPAAKKVYLAFALLFALFLVCNDLILPWYVNTGGIVTVPPVVGKHFEDAVKLLDSLGLEGRKGEVRMDREHAEGIVIIQNPPESSRVKHGRRVYLTLSGGELKVSVPNLKGRTIRDAKFALEREGLKLGAIEYQSSDEYPANTIIAQRVAANASVKRDGYVSVVVSLGRTTEKVPVPDLTNRTLQEAEKILASLGLRVGNTTYVPSPDLLPNTIVQQFPLAGELVEGGQAVDLFVVEAGAINKEVLEN